MKNTLLIFALLISPYGMAEDKTLVAAEATAANLSGAICALQSEEEVIMAEINAMDEKFEKDLNETIDYIVAFRDSYETGTSIIRNKKSLIDEIEESVGFFEEQSKRIDTNFKSDSGEISAELQTLKGIFKGKTKARTQQMVKLADSLNEYKEYYDIHQRESAMDRQKVRTADREKDRIIKTFERKIEDLKGQLVEIEKRHSGSYSMADNFYEYKWINERINLLEHSINDLLDGGDDGTKVGRVAGQRIDRVVREATARIKAASKTYTYALDRYQSVINQHKQKAGELSKIQSFLEKQNAADVIKPESTGASN
ncbi:hypothetical protein BH11VER1_BH11VER1_32420 [soil metagenome]